MTEEQQQEIKRNKINQFKITPVSPGLNFINVL